MHTLKASHLISLPTSFSSLKNLAMLDKKSEYYISYLKFSSNTNINRWKGTDLVQSDQ